MKRLKSVKCAVICIICLTVSMVPNNYVYAADKEPMFVKANGQKASSSSVAAYYLIPVNDEKHPHFIKLDAKTIHDNMDKVAIAVYPSQSNIETLENLGGKYAVRCSTWCDAGDSNTDDDDEYTANYVITDSNKCTIEKGYYKIKVIRILHLQTSRYAAGVSNGSSILAKASVGCKAPDMTKHNSSKTVEATCTTAGYKACSVCGKHFSDTPALGHTGHVRVEATCETGGYTYCTRCNVHTSEWGALGHDWDTGIVTTAPTAYNPGVLTHTCKRDSSHHYTETIPKMLFNIFAGTSRICRIYIGDMLVMNAAAGESSLVR